MRGFNRTSPGSLSRARDAVDALSTRPGGFFDADFARRFSFIFDFVMREYRTILGGLHRKFKKAFLASANLTQDWVEFHQNDIKFAAKTAEKAAILYAAKLVRPAVFRRSASIRNKLFNSRRGYLVTDARDRAGDCSIYGTNAAFTNTLSRGFVDRMYPTMKKRFKFMRYQYIQNYVLARRVRDHLNAGYLGGSMREASVMTIRNPQVLTRLFKFKKRKIFLLKTNPDTRGRSRSFYYLRKKARFAISANKSIKFLKYYQADLKMSSRNWSDFNRNVHMKRMRLERGKLRNNLRLKMYLRNLYARYFDCSLTNLFYKWKAIRQTSRKWLTYYRLFEAILWRYLKHLRLLPKKIKTKDAIRAGLISINGVICVNPNYVVRTGDVIILNNEAY